MFAGWIQFRYLLARERRQLTSSEQAEPFEF